MSIHNDKNGDMAYHSHVYTEGTDSWKLTPSQTVTTSDALADPFLVGVVDDSHSEEMGAGRKIEEPKVALETRVWKSIFCYGLVVHSIALGITIGIVQLSFRQKYWADDGHWRPIFFGLSTAATMNVLQFGAKIHEIFIVASLSLMVIHVARRMLIGRGVPLGLLSGAYQVGSAEYFFSPSYLSPLLWSIRHGNGRMFILAFMLGLSIIFANMIGPSSAIAIIPNLDWYFIAKPFQGLALTSYIGGTPAQIFPTVFDAVAENCTDVLVNGTVGTFLCPAGGHATLFDWALASANEDIGLQMSMIEPLGRTRRILLGNVTTDHASNSSLGIATTHSTAISALVGTFWHYVNNHGIDPAAGSARPRFHMDTGPVYSPLVQVECNAYLNSTALDEQKNLYFKSNNIRRFDSVPRPDLVVPPAIWNKTTDREPDSIQITWVGAADMKPEKADAAGNYYQASIGAFITLPRDLEYRDAPGEYAIDSYIVACTIDARWAASELSFDPNNDDIVTNNLTSTPAFDFLSGDPSKGPEARAQYGISDQVHISTDWIRSLDTEDVSQYDSQLDKTNTTAIASLFSAYLITMNDTQGMAYFIPPKQNFSAGSADEATFNAVAETAASVLALAIADGMSRSNYFDWGMRVSNGTRVGADNITIDDLFFQAGAFASDTESFSETLLDDYATSFTFNVERYGWGWGFQNQTTQFGVAILLIHVLLLVLYIAYLGAFRIFLHGWMSEAWADLGELVSVALLSRPPDHLKHTGVNIDLWQTWRYAIRIREKVDDPTSVEMLVGTHKELHKKNEYGLGIRKTKKYS